MSKARLEALADGVFAVAMTLLVFDIKVPAVAGAVTNAGLWAALGPVLPHVLVFGGTFIVLSTMWVNHHFLFQVFAKEIDRWLNLLSLLFLMFIAFVPFSASFISEYSAYQPSAIVYGANLLAVTFMSVAIVAYVRQHQGVEHVSTRLLNQARFRSTLNIICYLVGILVSFWSVYASLFFFVVPVVFNLIPGTLDFTERLLRFDLG